jgi:hypothetical protein
MLAKATTGAEAPLSAGETGAEANVTPDPAQNRQSDIETGTHPIKRRQTSEEVRPLDLTVRSKNRVAPAHTTASGRFEPDEPRARRQATRVARLT